MSCDEQCDELIETEYCYCRMYNSLYICRDCDYLYDYGNHTLNYCNLPPAMLRVSFSMIAAHHTNYKMRLTNLPYYLLRIYNHNRSIITLSGQITKNYKLYYYTEPHIRFHTTFINNYNYVDLQDNLNSGEIHKYI
jgi:hypothetical protein